MWIDAPSSAVSQSPKPSAASQCPAAIQRFRHSSHSSASAQAGTSTSRSPSEASAAISRSASGLRRVRMLAAIHRSSSNGPPRASTAASQANPAQPTASNEAASTSSDADSGRFGSTIASA